ncbi:hypothetical protein [Tellurirhabdus bombi]|uniref:hypothetical protein n=1 Tax=Tellurirhabdus bombi TaxID=2907205 RepID=UPI001F46ED9E|nr:hypothetical protein [Tellurirhabdus bombi]
MLNAAKIAESFQNLSGEISLDEAIERLIILERYEKGLEAINEGNTQKHEDVMQDARQWIQKEK